MGNHDATWVKRVDVAAFFESITNMAEIVDHNLHVTLCHYPMMTWHHRARGGYMVFGHIHNNTNAEYWPLIKNDTRMLNAAVEVNQYTPVTLDALIVNNRIFKESITSSDVNELGLDRLKGQKTGDC